MKLKKTISLICVLLLLFSSLSSTALAYEPETPADDPLDPSPYTYIATINIYFDISNSGLTDDYCQVYIPDNSYTCHLYMYLQRWNSSSGVWETVKSWYAEGSDTITLEKEWYVAYGYAYQLKNNIYVYDSNGLLGESTSAYSQIIPFGATYP